MPIVLKVHLMNIQTVALASLILDPVNARRHAMKNLEAIKGSLAKFGQQKPLVVGAGNVVIAGNGTLEAARQLGWETLECVMTELKGSEAMAFALADNRTAELAEWDLGILTESLEALGEEMDMQAFGFYEGDFEQTPAKEPKAPGDGSKELSSDDFDNFQHCCPRCGFEFNDDKTAASQPPPDDAADDAKAEDGSLAPE